MKKLASFILLAGVTLALTACRNDESTTTSSTQHSKQSSTKSHTSTSHSHQKEPKKSVKRSISSKSTKTNSQATSSQNTSTTQNQQVTPSQSQENENLTQGEINRQRGYDPNGTPVMPGSDHAAGTNPDGTEDDWVKGQDEWIKQHPNIQNNNSEDKSDSYDINDDYDEEIDIDE